MISIEGNVGCGKSTLIQRIRQDIPNTLEEPIEAWTNFHGLNLLKAFHEKPDRYGYLLQKHIMKALYQQHKLNPDIMERSILSARFCFTELMYRSGLLTEIEYKLIDLYWQKVVAKTKLPNTIIYLRSEPQRVLKNVKKRGRMGENEINLAYLQSIHDIHEDWLIRRFHHKNSHVLVIETKNFENKVEELYQVLKPYLHEPDKNRPRGITYL